MQINLNNFMCNINSINYTITLIKNNLYVKVNIKMNKKLKIKMHKKLKIKMHKKFNQFCIGSETSESIFNLSFKR